MWEAKAGPTVWEASPLMVSTRGVLVTPATRMLERRVSARAKARTKSDLMKYNYIIMDIFFRTQRRKIFLTKARAKILKNCLRCVLKKNIHYERPLFSEIIIS